MTLDGAIAHERENAKEHKDKAEYQINRGIEAPQINLHLQSETEQAEYHEQLAEWLEELKAYRTLDKTNFSDGYNSGIDDFKEAVKTAVTEMDDISAYVNPTERICEILKIESERLKAGDDNDR